jgi:RNA polymerase-associated protein CTR9
MYYRSG